MKTATYSILVLIFSICAPPLVLLGQTSTNSTFNHYALPVSSLFESAEFYQEIMGLVEVEDQTQKPNIRWFSLGNGLELHLIETSIDKIKTTKDLHLAMATTDIKGFMANLQKQGIVFENWQGKLGTTNNRPDGVKQIYLQDPDGYWIEVNDAKK
ncbi:MAG: lactoylglutathione lyase [Cyclobacteriaceae bacterium]|jgi:lactoylglutathione lyase